MNKKLTTAELRLENARLKEQLEEARETLRAITSGEVDALVVNTNLGESVFTLQGADSVYRTTLENINEGAVTLSPEGIILYSNRYFAQMLRTDLNKIIGTSIFEFVSAEKRQQLAEILAKNTGRLELEILAAGGTQIPTFLSTIQLQFDSPAICAVVTDLTLQKKNEDLIKSEEQLRKTEAELRTAKEQLDAALLNSPVVAFRQDRNLRYTWLYNSNNRLREGQFIGKTDEEIFGAQARPLIETKRKVINTGKSTRSVFDLSGDDKKFYYDTTIQPVFDQSGKVAGIVCTAVDITERIKMEETVAKAQLQIQSIIDNTPAIVYAFDLEDRFLMANTSTAEVLNSTPKQMIGKRRHEFMPKEDADRHEVNDRQVIETGKALEFEEYSHLPGRSITWLTSKFPLRNTQGRIYAVGGISTDISVRKQLEEKIQKLNENLSQRTNELELANSELYNFTNTMASELQEPINRLKGFSQAILEDYPTKLDKKGQEYLQYIHDSSQQMSSMINDVHRLASIALRDMDIHPLDMSRLAESVASGLRESDEQRQVKFEIAPGITCNGDYGLLLVVFENLLGNAWKFTAKTPAALIEFNTAQYMGQKTYFVRDNGAGFNMTYADNLFKPFKSLHSDSELAGKGTGLALVKRIIDRHGGRIWAEGAEGKGATFYFTLEKGK